MSRPTKFSKEVANIFFGRLIELGSVKAACQDDRLPTKTTIFNWLAASLDKDASDNMRWFFDQYTKAQRLSADYEIDSIVDDIRKDAFTMVNIDGEAVETVTGPSVAYARLLMDAKKWRAGKKNGKYVDGSKEDDLSVPDPIQVTEGVEDAS